MSDIPTEAAECLRALGETAGRIAAVTDGLAEARLQFRPDEQTWSANDILAHLRACADVWGKSILAMLAQEHPTLRYVSPRTWIRKTNYPSLEFRPSLAVFASQREGLLAALTPLATEGWARGATFTGTTRGREQTVLDYAQRLARHESEHCAQIEALFR